METLTEAIHAYRTSSNERHLLQIPPDYASLRRKARETLDAADYSFIESGAGTGDTKTANETRFDEWRIVPRVLADVSDRSLQTEILGMEMSAPLAVAPVPLALTHGGNEEVAIRAADSLGVPTISNTTTTIPMEDIAASTTSTTPLFQLYWNSNWDITASLVSRAEDAGFGAIVRTVDAPVPRWKPRDLTHNYPTMDRAAGTANYFSDPAFRAALSSSPDENPDTAVDYLRETFVDPSITWEDITFLREHTSLPIILKGILHPEDARKAIDQGIDGIVVSNHGGRQIDGGLSAIDALPQIANTVDGAVPIVFDSGIRTGADMYKAIALGADVVCLGRPVLYSLAVAEATGVREILLQVLTEFDSLLGMTGCPSVDQINRDCLRDMGERS